MAFEEAAQGAVEPKNWPENQSGIAFLLWPQKGGLTIVLLKEEKQIDFAKSSTQIQKLVITFI